MREQQSASEASAKGIEDRMRRAKADLVHMDEELRLQDQSIAVTERVVANLKPLAEERIVSDLQYQNAKKALAQK